MFDDLARRKKAGNKNGYKSRMAYCAHKVPRFSTGGALVSRGENTKKRKATRYSRARLVGQPVVALLAFGLPLLAIHKS